MNCPCCFGGFWAFDDYCYFMCPYSFECEECTDTADHYYLYYDDDYYYLYDDGFYI